MINSLAKQTRAGLIDEATIGQRSAQSVIGDMTRALTAKAASKGMTLEELISQYGGGTSLNLKGSNPLAVKKSTP